MSYYVPQPIAVYTSQRMQHFRKGECAPYENRVLVNSNVHKFTNIMLKRETSGDTCTVEIVDLNDTDRATLTVSSQTSWPLDDAVGEFEMHVLNAGNWTTGLSLPSGFYYLRIEDGANTWYSDEIYLDQVGSSTFPTCDQDFIKLTWTDGRCIVSGVASDGTTPMLSYPDTSHTFFMFLKAGLSQPEWDYEEQGEKDAQGKVVIETKRAEKRWNMEGFPVTEAIVDALISSAMFATVTIEFPDMPAFTGIENIRVERNWESGGCLALAQYSFSAGTTLVKQGCC